MPLTDKQMKELLAKLLAKRMVEICTAISFDPTTDTSLPPQGRWVYLDTVKKSFEILTDELEQAEREAIGQGRKLKITSNQLQDLANTSKTCFDGGNHLFWQNLANNLNEYFAAPRPEASTRELREALRDMLKLLDEGKLVRNISGDGESDWAFKQLPMNQVLIRAAKLADLEGAVLDAQSELK